MSSKLRIKSNKIGFKYIVLILVITTCFSCQDKPKRDLYPSEIIGSLELLSPERTGIDFSNTIQESTYFNHYYHSQMYVGSGVAIGVLIMMAYLMCFLEVIKSQIDYILITKIFNLRILQRNQKPQKNLVGPRV